MSLGLGEVTVGDYRIRIFTGNTSEFFTDDTSNDIHSPGVQLSLKGHAIFPWPKQYLGIPKSNIYWNLPESNINYRNPTILYHDLCKFRQIHC